jgi:hypothetical protein
MGSVVPQSIQVSVSDPAEIAALHERLRQVSDVRVSRTAGQAGPGEQGAAIDVLTAIGSSSGLVALIRTIPAYLRARRSGISVHTTVKGKDFTLTVGNVDDVMPIIERLLNE